MDIVIRHVQLPLGMPTSHINLPVQVSATELPTQLSPNASWEAAEDGSSVGAPATQVVSLDGY